MWPNAFEYCKGMCRSHGKSTMHENAYISSRHHCFSELGRPSTTSGMPGSLDGVEVVVSLQDQSCDEACASRSKQCSMQHMPLVNSCDRLREHLGCEAGCEACAKGSCSVSAQALPSYVVGNAPKSNRPAMCFVGTPELAATCAAKDNLSQRLCACA